MNGPPIHDAAPHRPALPLTGGCPCGAIRFEIGAFPLLLYACHCTDCQRRSGSAFALNMPVSTKAFRIVEGTPKAWRRRSPSGVDSTSWFCGDCGGRINGERAGQPESTTVRAGSLDDTSWLSPAAHFFMRSAQPWVRLPDGAACYRDAPPDFGPLVKAWRVRWDAP